jgi:hypothetical protein
MLSVRLREVRRKVRELIKETRQSPERGDAQGDIGGNAAESGGGILKHPNIVGLLNRKEIDSEIKGLPAHLMITPEITDGIIAEEREKYREYVKA